jgi:hypothetical protein
MSKNVYASLAQDLMTRDLTPQIKSLPHDIRLYNYFSGFTDEKTSQPIDQNNIGGSFIAEPTDRAKMLAARFELSPFWDMNNHEHTAETVNAGLGIYLATDPYVSSPHARQAPKQSYGSDLQVVQFKAGTKFLDLNFTHLEIKPDTIQALVAEGVIHENEIEVLFKFKNKEFGSWTLRDMPEKDSDHNFEEFRKLIQNIFKAQKIVLVSYPWASEVSAFCGSDRSSSFGSAFVFVGSPEYTDSILSTTLVFEDNYPNTLKLASEESEVIGQTQKLYQVLKNINELQRKAGVWEIKVLNDPNTIKIIGPKIIKIINDAYKNQDELKVIRDEFFNCAK